MRNRSIKKIAIFIIINFSFFISKAQNNVILEALEGETLDLIVCGSSNKWMRHNLGADTNQNPDVPSQAIIGNYYQWGRKEVAATTYELGKIYGWNTSNNIGDNSWNLGTEIHPKKNATNDPCPIGYRVPTVTEWKILMLSHTVSYLGEWSAMIDSVTNFSAALVLTCPTNGNKLTFPTAGYRGTDGFKGKIVGLGKGGYYFTSGPGKRKGYATNFSFSDPINSLIITNTGLQRSNGTPIRCISE